MCRSLVQISVNPESAAVTRWSASKVRRQHAGGRARVTASTRRRSRSVTGSAVITPLLKSSRNRSRLTTASAGVVGPSRTLRCARQAISAMHIAEEERPSEPRASARTDLPSGSFQCTCQGRRCRNTTSSSVLLQDQSAIECFRPTHDQGFPVWHAGGGPVRDGTNLGDRNATLFDNEGFALCHLAYDLAGL